MTMNALFATWDCMVCHEERPERFISVQHRPMKGMEEGFPDTRVNVRFCNDRVGCVQGAWANGRFHAADV